jgi:calcineurin-like phosphoesterase family protein
MYLITGDEHYFHQNKKNPNKGIIHFCNRPYTHIDDMHHDLIQKHNQIATDKDITIHAGDTSFGTKAQTNDIIRQLNGNHIFIAGCHDRWLRKSASARWIKKVDGVIVHVEHYPLRSWFASYHGSINLHAHTHGRLIDPYPRQKDIGVDTNNFYPYILHDLIPALLKQPNENI